MVHLKENLFLYSITFLITSEHSLFSVIHKFLSRILFKAGTVSNESRTLCNKYFACLFLSMFLWFNQAFAALNTCSSESTNNSELFNTAATNLKSNSRKFSESATVVNQRSIMPKDVLEISWSLNRLENKKKEIV